MDGYTILVFICAAIGFVILSIELFVPTAGMLALCSAACFIASGYCAWRAWYETGQLVWWWSYVIGMLVMIPSVVSFGLYWMPRTSWGKSLLFTPQTLEELTPFQDEESRLSKLIHQRGKAVTMFSPGGMAQVGRERFHAESEGALIDAGEEIVVVGVLINRLVVRPAALYDATTGAESRNAAAALTAAATPEAPEKAAPEKPASSLDFEIPDDV